MRFRSVLAAAILLAFAASAPAAKRTNLSETAKDSLYPDVAASGSRVHAVWIERTDFIDGPVADVLAASSADGGATFAAPVLLAEALGFPSGLTVEADGDRVHIAWLSNEFSTGFPIAPTYVRSTDGGAIFSAPIRMGEFADPASPQLCVDGDRVALVWSSRSNVWASLSSDGGESFADPEPLASSGAPLDNSARAAFSANALVVAWLSSIDGETATFVRSFDAATGEPIGDEVRVSTPGANGSGLALDLDGSTIALAWVEAGADRRVMVSRSDDGGATFETTPATGLAGLTTFPRVAVGSGVVHLAWVDDRSVVRYARWAAAAVDLLVGLEFRNSGSPELAAAGDTVGVVWSAGVGRTPRATVAVSADTGVSFSRPLRVEKGGRASRFARLAVDGAATHVVWQTELRGQQDTFYRRVER